MQMNIAYYKYVFSLKQHIAVYLTQKDLLAFLIAIYILNNIEAYFFKHLQFRLFSKSVMMGPSKAFMLKDLRHQQRFTF